MYGKMKKLLLGLKELTGNSDREFGYEYGKDIFLLDDGKTSFDFSFCKDEIGSLMRKLIDDKYISQTRAYHFKLEYRALHRWYAFWDGAKVFIVKSVIVPIVIAFITALITSNLTVRQELRTPVSQSIQTLP